MLVPPGRVQGAGWVLSAGCRVTPGAMHEVARQVDATGGAAVDEPERADLPESRMSCFFILL
jgi:hypothetical protein